MTDEERILETPLGPNSVFVDRLARLAEVDGDGRDEVIVVRSYLDAGAALAVYEVRGGALRRMAEAPAIGRPSRWLNPVGLADFDGDGVPELAAVITPHIGGILKTYSVEGDVLVEEVGSGRGVAVGVVIGAARHSSHVSRGDIATTVRETREESSDNFAFSLQAGIRVAITRSWVGEIGYRYIDMGKFDTGTFTTGDRVVGENYTAHDIVLGLVYFF